MNIVELQAVAEHLEELSGMLVEVVADGASIGFLPPLEQSEARRYWEQVPGPGVILFVAKRDGRIAGTVQVHLCLKQNGRHRAEIAKLMTHPEHRRHGVARLLMQAAEKRAKQEGRSLLVLDTREGDPSNLLYASLGFVQAGRIPNYAENEKGTLDATLFYYKNI